MPIAHPILPTVADLVEKALPRARWFAGKGRPARVRALIPLPWLESAELPAVRFEIAEVVPADSPDDVVHYLIAVCYRRAADPAGPGLGVAEHPGLGPVAVHDATTDPYAGDLILRLVSRAAELADEDTGTLRAHLVDGSGLRLGMPVRRFAGEQSNTSLMFGDVAMLKLFRRLEPGPNLDIETHRELGAGAAAGRIASLYGWLDADWVDSRGVMRHADLGMLVEQFSQAVDGWQAAVDHVTAGADFTDDADEIGAALREIHRGLADAFGARVVPASRRAGVMRVRLAETIAMVDHLAPLHGALDSRLAELDGMEQPVQRIHGDFHLGQTLWARGAWSVIDFEGEPLKDPGERRAFDTVWRDVAGMLRSFDYAGAYAVRERGTDPQSAADWVRETGDAFVTAYAGRDLERNEQQILRAYQIDKAAYECRYEAGNRPAWLPIPLTALASLAQTTEPHTFDGGSDER